MLGCQVELVRSYRLAAQPRDRGVGRIGPRGSPHTGGHPQLPGGERGPGRKARRGPARTGAAYRPGDAGRLPHGAASTVRPSPTRRASPAATNRTSEPRSGTEAEQPCTASSRAIGKRQLTPCAGNLARYSPMVHRGWTSLTDLNMFGVLDRVLNAFMLRTHRATRLGQMRRWQRVTG